MTITLKDIALPEFGMPKERPELSPALYAERVERLRKRARDAGLSALIVYADREHFANMAYLLDFEPRFEEALLILVEGRKPVVMTGPENAGRAAASKIEVDVVKYAPFGLLGQDRSSTRPLADILREAGIASGAKIGTAGWKYYSREEAPEPETWIEAPSFIVDTLRAIAGAGGRVVNATALLMDPSTGMRAINEIDQIAQFEYASCYTSEAVKRVLFGVRPGMKEQDVVGQLMQPNGVPLSCHIMFNTGPDARFGLNSPRDRAIATGETATMAYGTWGAVTCRAGWLAEDEGDLPAHVRDYAEKLAGPYFATAAAWYDTIGIGVTGGEIDAVVKRVAEPHFRPFLNPGHLIHLDEWLSTPIYPGSTERLQSGQAFQCDIIPTAVDDYFTSNIEEGIVLLDENGRAALRERYPEASARIEAGAPSWPTRSASGSSRKSCRSATSRPISRRSFCRRDGRSREADPSLARDARTEPYRRVQRLVGHRKSHLEGMTVLYWALIFLLIAIVAGALGFGGIAGASAGIAQILFFVFLVLLVISLIMHFMRRA